MHDRRMRFGNRNARYLDTQVNEDIFGYSIPGQRIRFGNRSARNKYLDKKAYEEMVLVTATIMGGGVLNQIANGLSMLTILSCLFLKVPQIMQIQRTRSAEGLYVQAIVMEITGFTIMTLYNFTNNYNMMTYLEYPIILAQIYILVFFVLKYKNMLYVPAFPIIMLSYVIISVSFAMEILPKNILAFLVPFCTPLSGFAKVTYMYGIIQAGNAEAVSLTTWVISITTNLFRIFTVYEDSGDLKLMGNFAIATLLSTGVLLTALLYKSAPGSQTPAPAQRRRRSSHED